MRRGVRLTMIGLLCVLVSGGVMASDAAATTGDLTQKPGVAGCWSAVGLCSPGTALAGARSVTVSPDGRSAYAASQAGSAVVVFDRAVDGTLTQKPGTAGCISDTGAGPCVDGTALDNARSVTVSPDGRSAYVASGSIGAVAVFDRAVDGTLTQKPGTAGCISDTGAGPCVDGTALGGAFEVTVSPDGRNAYVASNSSGAVAVFDRAADGTLTQKAGTAACISDTGAGPCGDGTGLGGSLGVVVSPDGTSAYVASFDSAAVAVLDRAADGTLTQRPGTAGCISDTGAGPCVDGTALDGASSVTVSPDGRSVYVASQISSAVAVFDRAADGTLTQKPATAACVSDTGAGPCIDGTALAVAASVAISPDGQSAYVASFDSDAVAVLDRAADGSLTQTPGTAGCISDTAAGPCLDGAALDGNRWVTVSPDGRSVYAASVISGAVAVFDREPPAPPSPPSPAPPPPAEPRPFIKTLRRVPGTPAPATGRPLLLTAEVVGNATRIAWNVDLAGRTSRIVAPVGQKTLRLVPTTAGRLSVSAQPIGPGGSGQTSVTALAVAPTPRTSVTRRLLGAKVLADAPVVAAIDLGPGFDVSDVFDRAGKCMPTTLRAGSLQVDGCMHAIVSVDQIPVAERGILREMTDRLRASPTTAQLNTALEQLNGYLVDAGDVIGVNGLAVTPRDGGSVVIYPELEAVASSNADMAIGSDPRQRISLGNPNRFLLDVGQRVRGEIPLGPLPRVGGLERLAGFGFGTGQVTMRLVPGEPPSTLVTVRLRLPSWLSIGALAAEGEATFRATPDRGLVLQDMRIGPIDADLGAARVKALQIAYRSENDEWEGGGEACVISACLKANVLIAGDALKNLSASLPLPPPGITLFPFVQLYRIGFGGGLDPTRFYGEAGITAYGIYDITARATLAFPSAAAPFRLNRTESPGFPEHLYGVPRDKLTLAASGSAAIKVPFFDRVPFANGHFLYEYPGYFALGGQLLQTFGPLKLDGRMGGEFNAANGRFNVEGGVTTCFTGFSDVADFLGASIDLNVCRGGNGVFSNRGAAGCAKIIWRFGVGYDFRTNSPSFWPFGCKWERYRELNVREKPRTPAATAAQADAGRPPLVVRIRPGERPRALAFRGTDGAPRLRVRSSDGERVEIGPTVVGVRTIRVLRSERWKNTTIGLMRPGTYRIEALPDSPTVSSISQAIESPQASINARVEGRGTRRVLRYRIRDRADQRVTFMEVTSRGTSRPIGTVEGGGRGTLRFSPAPGTERRVVEAQFTIDGWPAERRRVAGFRPPSPRLARPSRLHVRRHGTTLRVAWRGVAGATRHDAVLTPSVGPQRVLRVRGTRATIRRVARTVSGRVAVRAVSTQRKSGAARANFRRIRRPRTGFGPLPKAPRVRR